MSVKYNTSDVNYIKYVPENSTASSVEYAKIVKYNDEIV